MDEIAYFSVPFKTRKLVLSTTLNQELKPIRRVETENGPIGRESQPD